MEAPAYGLADTTWARTRISLDNHRTNLPVIPRIGNPGRGTGEFYPIIKWWQTLMSQSGVPYLDSDKAIPGHHT